ncbi:hypothetical protein [Actinoalloteichus hymeniacidonis]|uniref:hypothetical protein n=1 Tax=Actinoalloteichus hymeniacidonis TaxID=340345 RepID=UPI0012FB6F54|nr:hypothetical protein [Actinoalloteichus hymeniacidonis]MBB5908544.1 hypothetical protein [Actinoalloteichus hymeniacidonis]
MVAPIPLASSVLLVADPSAIAVAPGANGVVADSSRQRFLDNPQAVAAKRVQVDRRTRARQWRTLIHPNNLFSYDAFTIDESTSNSWRQWPVRWDWDAGSEVGVIDIDIAPGSPISRLSNRFDKRSKNSAEAVL